MDNQRPTGESLLECLGIIAQFHGLSFNKDKVKHAYGKFSFYDDRDLIILAKNLGLKSKKCVLIYDDLAKMILPAIVKLKDDSYVILAKVDEEKSLILNPQKDSPEVFKKEDFEMLYSGTVFLFAKKSFDKKSTAFGMKWFLPDIIRYKKPLFHVLLAAFVLQILGLFTPMMMQVVIDKVLVHHSYTTLDVIAIGLIIISVFEFLMSLARTYVFSHTVSRIDVMLGARLFKHLFSLPFRYFETRRVGDTIARVRELENIRAFLTGTPLTLLIDTVFVAVYIVVMFFYSSKLTFIVLLSLPIFALISLIVTPIFRHNLEERFQTGAKEQSYLVEAVTGVQTIKSLALESQVQRKFEDLISDYIKSTFKTNMISARAGAVAQMVQKIVDIIILWMGAHLVIGQTLSVGSLIAFRILASKVSTPILRLVQVWQDFQQTSVSIQRLGDIFHTKAELSLDQNKVTMPTIRGDIEFEKVRFRYQLDGHEVIRDMSFKINHGEIIGIVGRSGSGKSTISKLIQRLYIPEAGKITIDKIDISMADVCSLRRQIGVVLQENFLFGASVRDNISIHNPSCDLERIIEVAKISGAHEFILELPNGYDTLIGENGTGLSGGQKQRIAIARALLNHPKILIFDEATSALDYESESIIQKNLKKICEGRTVIMIAHRLSTLKDADRIMAIDRGELIEFGTKTELIEKKGLYYYLRSRQEEGKVC